MEKTYFHIALSRKLKAVRRTTPCKARAAAEKKNRPTQKHRTPPAPSTEPTKRSLESANQQIIPAEGSIPLHGQPRHGAGKMGASRKRLIQHLGVCGGKKMGEAAIPQSPRSRFRFWSQVGSSLPFLIVKSSLSVLHSRH